MPMLCHQDYECFANSRGYIQQGEGANTDKNIAHFRQILQVFAVMSADSKSVAWWLVKQSKQVSLLMHSCTPTAIACNASYHTCKEELYARHKLKSMRTTSLVLWKVHVHHGQLSSLRSVMLHAPHNSCKLRKWCQGIAVCACLGHESNTGKCESRTGRGSCRRCPSPCKKGAPELGT